MERINPLVAPFSVFSIFDTQMQRANIANHHFSGQTKERKKKTLPGTPKLVDTHFVTIDLNCFPATM